MVKYPHRISEPFSIKKNGDTYTGTRTLEGKMKVRVSMEFKGEYLTDDKIIPIKRYGVIDFVSNILLNRLVDKYLKNKSID